MSAGAMNVAVHFVVDPGGVIVRTLPDTRYGRHTVGFNHASIAIEHLEMVQKHGLTSAQVEATTGLIRALTRRHGIRYLAGHHQLVNEPETHPLFVEQVDSYRTFARDPGDEFVERVATGLADLDLIRP